MNRTSRNWRSQNVPFELKIKGFEIKRFEYLKNSNKKINKNFFDRNSCTRTVARVVRLGKP